MKHIYRLPLPVSLLVLILIFTGLSATGASGQSPADGSFNKIDGQESNDILTYRVSNVFTREDRTAIAAQPGALVLLPVEPGPTVRTPAPTPSRTGSGRRRRPPPGSMPWSADRK